MLLDALEQGDSDMARSIATVQVDERRRWIERLRTGAPAAPSIIGQPLTPGQITQVRDREGVTAATKQYVDVSL